MWCLVWVAMTQTSPHAALHRVRFSGAAPCVDDIRAGGAREREHLQEWVIEHPEVLGTGLLVVTAEYDSWRAADGVASRDRLDVLALESSGRLVVAELKRDADRDVYLQAITYAALVSRFDMATLAAAHARFRSQRGRPTTDEEARELLLEHVEGEWDLDLLRQPAIVLVAGGFPRVVTHSAVWLSEMGLSVALVQVALWRSPEGLVTSFERLYPVAAVEQSPSHPPGRRARRPGNGRR